MVVYDRPPMAATTTQRREQIRERVATTGAVRIDALAREFGVTSMTIHRDLDALETEGWLRKVRGGATAQPAALIDTTVRHRATMMVDAKRAVAAAALEHIEGGEVLLLDDSTTVLELAKLLPGRGPLTVITNFLMTINALAGQGDVELIALGGTYSAAHDAFLGPTAADEVGRLRADLAFMSTTAVLDGQLFHKSEETIQIRKAMLRSAARKILLIDHQKLSRRATHYLASLTDFDAVIVDDRIDAGSLSRIEELGVAVQVAPAVAA